MKILLISKDKSLYDPKSAAYKELLEAAERVEEVHVIIFTDRTDSKGFIKVGNVLMYPTNSKHPLLYAYNAYNLAKFELTLKFRLIDDLISAEDGIVPALTAALLSWKYGKNYIMGVHKYFEDETANDDVIVKAFKKDVRYRLMKRAAGIRVSSQAIGEEIYSNAPEFASKIYILPSVSEMEGVTSETEHTDVHLAYPEYNIIIMQAARSFSFSTVKRAGRIINVLRTRYQRIGMVLIGDLEHPIFNWPRKFFLPKGLTFGKRPRDITSYFRTANVYADTSLKGLPGSELTNAALAGCPIVAAKNPKSEETLTDGENGFFADPGNSHLFARKIMDILEQAGLREQMRFARFNISEVYGTGVNDYVDRLVGIWDACKTVEELTAHIPKAVNLLTPKVALKSKAITMLVAERAKQKIAKDMFSAPVSHGLDPREGENSYVLDLSMVKENIEEAIKDIEEKLPETSEEEDSTIDVLEV